MPEFFAVLVLVPTAAVLAIGVLYIVGTIVIGLVSVVDAIVVALRDRFHGTDRPHNIHLGTPVPH